MSRTGRAAFLGLGLLGLLGVLGQTPAQVSLVAQAPRWSRRTARIHQELALDAAAPGTKTEHRVAGDALVGDWIAEPGKLTRTYDELRRTEQTRLTGEYLTEPLVHSAEAADQRRGQ